MVESLLLHVDLAGSFMFLQIYTQVATIVKKTLRHGKISGDNREARVGLIVSRRKFLCRAGLGEAPIFSSSAFLSLFLGGPSVFRRIRLGKLLGYRILRPIFSTQLSSQAAE